MKKYNFSGGVYGMGDIHGQFGSNAPISQVVKNLPPNSLLIQVGDFGLGFLRRDREKRMLVKLDDLCRAFGVDLWVIRGNHDQKGYWDGSEVFNERYSNFRLVPDYTYCEINGFKFLFAGGAISLDRTARKEGIDYWKDEKFAKPEGGFTRMEVDVLVTHSAPDFLDPPVRGAGDDLVSYYSGFDPDLIRDLEEERAAHTALVESLRNLKIHIHGHFHRSQTSVVKGVRHRCLDINEADEIR